MTDLLDGQQSDTTDSPEQQMRRLQAELDLVKTQLMDFRTRVRDVAIRRAIEHEWCSVIDDVLEELDLEPRVRSYAVEIAVTYKTSVTVSAKGGDEAINKVEGQGLARSLQIVTPFLGLAVNPYADEFTVKAVEAEVLDD